MIELAPRFRESREHAAPCAAANQARLGGRPGARPSTRRWMAIGALWCYVCAVAAAGVLIQAFASPRYIHLGDRIGLSAAYTTERVDRRPAGMGNVGARAELRRRTNRTHGSAEWWVWMHRWSVSF